LPPQAWPATEALVPPFSQVCVPVTHEVTPTWHGSGCVEQEAPDAQLTQLPALHTLPVPQAVPLVPAVAPFSQVWVPVAHEVIPVWQGSGWVVQAALSRQPTHAPEKQTRFVPHEVPSASAVPVSLQNGWAPLQAIAPVWHLFVSGEQAPPGTQGGA